MLRTTALLIVLALVISPAWAEEGAGATVSLFDGQSLQGWHVTGCRAGVEEGALVIQEGNGLVRTDHRYRDFVLELSWKARQAEKYDAGIYIRAPLPAEGKTWPDKHQVNLRQGDEGNLLGFNDARSKGLIKPGAWNHFKLTVVGQTAALEINGQSAWKTSGITEPEGHIGIQVEVPQGGQFEFKDLRVTELGYTSLFNGRDLSGWEGAGDDAAKCWKVEEGLLVCTGKKGPWLRSAQEYDDFNLRLAYKLKEGGNSGVFIRVPKNGNHHGAKAGIEVQVLEDHAPRYAKLKPFQYSGSLYGIVPADPRVSRAAGEWNTLEIDCHGRRYRIWHNGVPIIDATPETHPELAERNLAGFLGLQNHSEEVWFRDVRIGPSTLATAEEGATK